MTQKYKPHILALSSLFTFGNAVIIMSGLNLFNLLMYFASALIMMFLAMYLFNLSQKNKFLYFCAVAFVCATAVYSAAITFLDYIKFLKNEQLPQTNVLLLGITFAVTVAFFTISKTTAIYKYSLFVFVLIVAIMAICFVGGIKSFDYQNLDTKALRFSFSLKNFMRFFVSLVALVFFVKKDKRDIKPMFFGVSIGFLMLLVAMLQIMLTFGANSNISFPYLKSISVISSGSLFTRLDGLVWFVFFITALIKTVVCIKVVKNCIIKQ